MQRRFLRSAICNRQTNQDIVLGSFGVFGKNIEVTIFIKNAGIDQLELRRTEPAPAIFLDQPPVWIFRLRIFVECLHVTMRRCRVEVVIKFLHVLAVIPFWAGQTEQTLFQNRIFAVPKGEGETKPALPIGDAEQSILAPAISAAPRVIVREIIPAIAVG